MESNRAEATVRTPQRKKEQHLLGMLHEDRGDTSMSKPDSQDLFDKFAAVDACERYMKNAIEAISEIRYEGIDGIREEAGQLLSDIQDCKRKTREAYEAEIRKEEDHEHYGRVIGE